MTLSSAFNIVNSSFAAIGTQSATIANNIANANTPSYTRQIVNLAASPGNGVSVYSITSEADDALAAQLNVANSEAAAQNAISAGLTTLSQTVSDSATETSAGTLVNGGSPAAMIANFDDALTTYEADPSNQAAADAAVAAADDLASSLNAGSAAVTQVRTQADQEIGQAVAQVNTLLSQFETVNNAIVAGQSTGANVGSLNDQRSAILNQIAQQIGVTSSTSSDGSMSIYTDSGVLLFQNVPMTVSFTTSGSLGAGATGNQVYVNGTPITGASSNMPIQSGAIAGLVQLRDTIAPQYQAQLDQVAGSLISAFQETDQSTTATGLPALPGLFTTPGATSVPSSSDYTGLASAITVNPNVDPRQGGNALLLRDGGISDTANDDYTYNTGGDAGYTGRISQLVSALQTPTNFGAAGGLPGTSSITAYAQSSVSWLQGAYQQASAAATYQTSLQSQASSALNNATGVNLDTELTNMLTIESSYTASAKLLTTASAMLNTLVNAV